MSAYDRQWFDVVLVELPTALAVAFVIGLVIVVLGITLEHRERRNHDRD